MDEDSAYDEYRLGEYAPNGSDYLGFNCREEAVDGGEYWKNSEELMELYDETFERVLDFARFVRDKDGTRWRLEVGEGAPDIWLVPEGHGESNE